MRADQQADDEGHLRWRIVETGGWSPDSCVLVERFLRHLQNRSFSPNTVEAYARDLSHHLRYLQAASITTSEFRPKYAVEFLEYLVNLPVSLTGGKSRTLAVVKTDKNGQPGRKRAGSTVNRAMAATSSFYEFAISAEEYASENPILKVADRSSRYVSDRHTPFMGRASRQQPVRRATKVRTPRRQPRPISDEDVEALLGSMRTLRDQAIFLVMLDGGLRPGEALGIQIPDDIEFGRRRVWIRKREDHPKGVRQKSLQDRPVDLEDPRTLAAINAYIMRERPRDSGSPYLFLISIGKRRGEPLSDEAWQRLFRRHAERLGIKTPWLTPHALRHTHATAMSDAGMGEFALQKRLGHASPESTRIYTRISDERVKREYQQATEKTRQSDEPEEIA